MPTNLNYWSGDDLGQPTVLPPFEVTATPLPVDPWDWSGTNGGVTDTTDDYWGGAGTYVTPQPPSVFEPPIQRAEPMDEDGSDYNRIYNELLAAENARRAIAGQSPVRPYDKDIITSLADEAQRKVGILTTLPTDPGHGVIDTTQSPNNSGNIGIGIPGLFGVGLGGVMLGGLLGGGSGGGGGSATSGGGQSGGGAIIPPVGYPTDTGSPNEGGGTVIPPPIPVGDPNRPAGPYPAGVNETPNTNPTIIPAPLPGSPNEQGGGTIVPPPVIPTTPTAPGVVPGEGGGGTIIPVPVPTPTPTPTPAPTPTTPQPNPTTPTVPTTTIANPLDRNFYREGSQTISDLNRLGKGLYGNYAQFAPQYTQADLANYASTLGVLGSTNQTLTGIANQQTQAANTSLRQGNLTDAQNLAPQADALRRATNPELYANLDRLDAAAASGIQRSPYEDQLGATFARGNSQLGSALDQSALDQLQLGSSLSNEENRAASQAAREGWSARGLVNSTGAVAEEVLQRYNLGNDRLKQRQTFAQNAYGQQQAAEKQNQGLGLSLAGLDQTRQGQNVSNLATAANFRNATAFDPFNMASTQNTGSNASLFGQGSGFSSGAQSNASTLKQFDPFAPYPQDVYNSNYNAANARNIAAGNNAAALAGAKDTNNGVLVNNFLNLLGSLYGKS